MTDGSRGSWRTHPRHRWMGISSNPTPESPAFLKCKQCGLEHTCGHFLGRNPPSSFWCRFPGQEWTRYGDGRLPRIPVCPRAVPVEGQPPASYPVMKLGAREGRDPDKWHQRVSTGAGFGRSCKFCGMEWAMGSDIGEKPPGSTWYRFPGQEWVRYSSDGRQGSTKCPPCSVGRKGGQK